MSIPLSTHHKMEFPKWMDDRSAEIIAYRNAEYWNDETAKWARRVSVALCAIVIAAAVVSGLGLVALQLTYGDGRLIHPSISTQFIKGIQNE